MTDRQCIAYTTGLRKPKFGIWHPYTPFIEEHKIPTGKKTGHAERSRGQKLV